MGRHKNEREPCPWRVVDDLGGGFCFGMVIGTVWHGFAGLRHAPSGSRLKSSASRIASRVPVMAGGFAMWAMTYSLYECAFSSARGKEDMWNPIMSGAMTGGTLALRAGPRVAAGQFVLGGAILAGIEGFSVWVNRYFIPMMSQDATKQDWLEPPVDVLWKHRHSSGISSSGSLGSGSGSKGFDLTDIYAKSN